MAADTPDLTAVDRLDEEGLLRIVAERYAAGSVYTYIGPILLALRPPEALPIYGEAQAARYRAATSRAALSPHVYRVAHEAFAEVAGGRASRCIVVSGASGAGKSETAKHVLRSVSWAFAEGGGGGALEAKLLAAQPLLEALGSCATPRNANSSRFGAFFRMQCSGGGALSSCSAQVFLLEKGRVPCPPRGERNFHVFYQLLAAGLPDLPPELQAALGGAAAGPADFAFLRGRGGARALPAVDDAAALARTRAALRTLGLADADVGLVLELVCALLLLGEVRFAHAGADGAGGQPGAALADAASRRALVAAAAALACDAAALEGGLCTRRLRAGAEQVTQRCSVAEAAGARDGLASGLYGGLVGALMRRANSAMGGGRRKKATAQGAPPFLGVLDMPGLEALEVNGLEQLCANFCAEKLHAHYAKEVSMVAEAPAELQLPDNRAVLDALEGRPAGLAWLLQDACARGEATDDGWCAQLRQRLQGSAALGRTAAGAGGGAFTLRHYAAEVTYEAAGFVAKNRDALPEALRAAVGGSRRPLVGALLGEAPGDGEGSAGVLAQLSAQLEALLQALGEAQCSFVRCVRPSDGAGASELSGPCVRAQLRTLCALQSAAALSRGGGADRPRAEARPAAKAERAAAEAAAAEERGAHADPSQKATTAPRGALGRPTSGGGVVVARRARAGRVAHVIGLDDEDVLPDGAEELATDGVALPSPRPAAPAPRRPPSPREPMPAAARLSPGGRRGGGGGAAAELPPGVADYARYLGMEPLEPADAPLLWIAQEALFAPVPPPWAEEVDAEGGLLYRNAETGQSTRQHPSEGHYRALLAQHRPEPRPQPPQPPAARAAARAPSPEPRGAASPDAHGALADSSREGGREAGAGAGLEPSVGVGGLGVGAYDYYAQEGYYADTQQMAEAFNQQAGGGPQPLPAELLPRLLVDETLPAVQRKVREARGEAVPPFPLPSCPFGRLPLRAVLCEPAGMSALVQCHVLRCTDKGGLRYDLFLELPPFHALHCMSARKARGARRSLFRLGLGRDGGRSVSGGYLGKLSAADVGGLRWDLFSPGLSPKRAQYKGVDTRAAASPSRGGGGGDGARAAGGGGGDDEGSEGSGEEGEEEESVQGGDGAALRSELLCLTFQRSILGSGGPTQLTAALPAEATPGGGCGPPVRPRVREETLHARLKAGKTDGLALLSNKAPAWDERLQSYTLKYNGRATEPSVKNIQLVDSARPADILFQLGKVGSDRFNVDYKRPFSALQAFAIAVAVFDDKMLCSPAPPMLRTALVLRDRLFYRRRREPQE